MSIKSATIKRLLAIEELTAIVEQRIHGVRSPQAPAGTPLPRVNVQVTQNQNVGTLAGPSGLKDAKVVITFWASTEALAIKMARIVRRSGLDGFKGVMEADEDEPTLDIQHFLHSDDDEVEEPSLGNETQAAFGVAAEYSVMYREAFTTPAFVETE
jgi:hypothetical protein